MRTVKARIDMLEGSLWDKILKFALPLAATGILQQLFNAADMAVVGRFTAGDQGVTAMAAVGANTPVIGLILNLFLGMALGTNVVIANAIGRKDEECISKAVHTSVLFALLVGIGLGSIGELISASFLSSQNLPDEVLPMAVLYFRVYMTGMPVILLYNYESAVFRAMGDTRTPLIALVISGTLNVILNLFFVIVFHRTAEGVAMATVIANAVSSLILMVKLVGMDSAARLDFRKLRIHGDILKKILRIGVPAGLQAAVFALTNLIVQAAINSLGTVVIAASGAAFNIETFAFFVMNSFGQACTTFVGQNYGAKSYRRCKRTMGLCMLEGYGALAISVGLILFFGHQMLSAFNPDPEVIRLGYERLILVFASYAFGLLYGTMSGYMRGFTISIVPAVLTMIGVCGVRIGWIYTVFPLYKTFESIIIVYPISLAVNTLLIGTALLIMRPAAMAIRAE